MAPQFPIETNTIIMDSKLVKQYGSEILSYRLRTVRQKKRMQYEDFDKKLLKLDKEETRLFKQKRIFIWEPLKPPVQRGWNRFFVLREDVATGKHAAFFENILSKINTCDWSHRKDFMVKYRRFGRKKYRVKKQSLLRPEGWRFNRMGFTDEEKLLFDEVWEINSRKELVKRYVFREPWRFVLRVRPNIIDKICRRDAMVDSRYQEIRNYLGRNYYRGHVNKLLYGTDRNSWGKGERAREKSLLKNKPLPRILDECAQSLL
jgi:hypothetical protein